MLCVKTMRDMIAKLQDGYKNNAMHVNPKHKWCMKKNRFDRSKVLKNHIFEKQSILMQKLFKAHYFIKKMHEYGTKSFSKNTWIQSRSSKMKIFNQFVLKAQTLNTFCIKIKELLILDGHNKITHNIMYQV